MKLIFNYVRKYFDKMILLLIVIVITTIIVAFYPWLFGKLVDALFYKKDLVRFVKIVGIYCIIFLVNQVLHFVLNMTYASLQTKFVFDIKKDMLNKVLAYPAKNLVDIDNGDILYRINKDVDELMKFIYFDIFYSISAILDLLACFIISVTISLPLAIFSLILASISFVLSKYFREKLKKINDQVIKLSSKNQSWLLEILSGMRDIKLLNAGKFCAEDYINREKEILQHTNAKVKEEVTAERCSEGVKTLSIIGIFTGSAFLMKAGKITIGEMTAVIDYFFRIALMMNRLYQRTFSIPARMVSIERLIEILEKPTEDVGQGKYQKIERGCIDFCNVNFKYSDRKEIFNDLTLHIGQEEKVALVGPNGTGKSTISNLLCRLYEVDKGEIKIDGKDIREYSLASLRSQIGVLQQECSFFEQSIRYNLIFTNDCSQDDKIWEALGKAGLENVIKKMPQKLDTILNPSSIEMSGGQQQRFMLARLYLKNCKIVIMDEPTSALDAKTEQEIVKVWEQLYQNKTVIVIAHRFSTISRLDKVIYLDKGRIVGCDEHQKLLKNCPEYNRWLEKQIEEGV